VWSGAGKTLGNSGGPRLGPAPWRRTEAGMENYSGILHASTISTSSLAMLQTKIHKKKSGKHLNLKKKFHFILFDIPCLS